MRRLAAEPIAAVYCSDLIRAVQTAEVIAAPHSLKPVALPSLREVHFGLWEGLTYAEIMDRWPEQLTTAYSHPERALIPEGENFLFVQQRSVAGVLQCVAAHPEETIAVVAHGGTLRMLLCEALGLAVDHMWTLQQDAVGISIVEYYGTGKVVVLMNDTCHLR